MKEKTLVSTLTLLGSLVCYYFGKLQNKDVVPYVMIGGFVGAWVGELIAKFWLDKNNKDQDKEDEKN